MIMISFSKVFLVLISYKSMEFFEAKMGHIYFKISILRFVAEIMIIFVSSFEKYRQGLSLIAATQSVLID
jgi:hypothetical protein